MNFDFTKLHQPMIPSQYEVNPDLFDNFSEVNRLVIIGNGFDLAHGLKSSFKDFIEDYFYNILHYLRENDSYKDLLISIKRRNYIYQVIPNFEILSKQKLYKKFFDLSRDNHIKIENESEFLKYIYLEIDSKTWVDIEVIFFKMLKDYSKNEEEIKKINLEMNYLKKKLRNYLMKEVERAEISPIPKIIHQFNEKLRPFETQPNTVKRDKEINSLCILNFNYTNTPELYLKNPQRIYPNHIQIHGSLEGDDITSQGLVFGFGDELDEEYLKFENLGDDNLFEHIKSFKYLQFQHYRNLLDFIESTPFQVHIYGHSLGLSDRTLLNTIFEHNNCISIKIFYHKWDGGDDFEKKCYAISRHFKSKIDLRSKVVNKIHSVAMAQALSEV